MYQSPKLGSEPYKLLNWGNRLCILGRDASTVLESKTRNPLPLSSWFALHDTTRHEAKDYGDPGQVGANENSEESVDSEIRCQDGFRVGMFRKRCR